MAARLRLLYHINLVNIQPVRIVAFLNVALASCVIVCRQSLVVKVHLYILHVFIMIATHLMASISMRHTCCHASLG